MRTMTKTRRHIGVDPPVALLIGRRQRVPGGVAAHAQVREPFGERAQRGLDVPHAVAVGQLRDGHDQALVSAGEAVHAASSLVSLDAAVEGNARCVCYEVRKTGASRVPHPLRS